jgi:ABC-type Fe3+/spermidine/putrescine transport system ATPase subunit
MAEITLDNLTRRYPRQPAPAVRDISLVVQRGELLALLGPSGSGKSTILKMVAGLDRPDQGDIRFDGRSVLDIPANRRGAVLMFQRAYLFPFLTVAENIGFGLKVQGRNRQHIRSEVARMLELVELPLSMERRYPAQLSGGEQQRVALARALVVTPRVLLLDEPLSSLDTGVRQTLQEVIRRVQRELGITTVLVTHDLSEAVSMSDRTALLLHNTIAACERPERLFQRPPTRETARFVGISTFLQGRIEGAHLATPYGTLALPTLPVVGDAPPRTATFAIRPEHLRLLPHAAPNALPGVVADVIYKGEFSEYQVALGDAVVRVRSSTPVVEYAAGRHVFVQFPAEHLFEVEA